MAGPAPMEPSNPVARRPAPPNQPQARPPMAPPTGSDRPGAAGWTVRDDANPSRRCDSRPRRPDQRPCGSTADLRHCDRTAGDRGGGDRSQFAGHLGTSGSISANRRPIRTPRPPRARLATASTTTATTAATTTAKVADTAAPGQTVTTSANQPTATPTNVSAATAAALASTVAAPAPVTAKSDIQDGRIGNGFGHGRSVGNGLINSSGPEQPGATCRHGQSGRRERRG